MIELIVHGAAGRMGHRVMALAHQRPSSFRVVAGLERADHPAVGQRVEEVPILASGDRAALSERLIGAGSPVVIDFSTPGGLTGLGAVLLDLGLPLVSGTTGLGPAEQALLDRLAGRAAVLWAPNTSLGVSLLARLVTQAAARLGTAAQIEIVETHHRHKADAPSGTALRLAEAVRQARPDLEVRPGRSGLTAGGRAPRELGIQSVRMGEVVGDHDVHLALDHEIITLSHRALSRDLFAAGALAAAAFVARAAAGRYDMDAVTSAAPGE